MYLKIVRILEIQSFLNFPKTGNGPRFLKPVVIFRLRWFAKLMVTLNKSTSVVLELARLARPDGTLWWK